MGILDQRPADLTDPAAMRLAQPVLSGGEGGRSVSYYQLASAGVTLLGRLLRIEGERMLLADNRDDNVAYADEAATAFRRDIDEYIRSRGIIAPEIEPDPADEKCALPPAPGELHLGACEVGTVLWCTGYEPSVPCCRCPSATQACTRSAGPG